MQTNSKISTKRIVVSGLMAALTVAGSALRITLPIDIAGTTSFHLGNIMCALSGILLGPWLGGFSAGMGSAIYDMLNPLYISEAWLTFLMKGLYGLITGLVVRGLKNRSFTYRSCVVGTVAGALAYAAAYLAKSYFYSGILLKGLTPDAALLAVIAKIPATTFNAVIAVICAPMLAMAIAQALKKSNITLD